MTVSVMPVGFEMLGALVAVIGILFLAYWCTRFLGKRTVSIAPGNYLKVIERLQVGTDRYLLLVKLQDHTYLLGVSDKGIELLAEPEGTFEEPEPGSSPEGFQAMLKNYGKLWRQPKSMDELGRGDRHE